MPLVVRCACLFGRCCDSDLFVHQAHMDGDICAADTRISLTAPTADHHIRVRIITTLPMRDHSSFVIEGATNMQEQITRILFLCHSSKPTYGDDYCGDGADEHRPTERASIEHPHHQSNCGNQDPRTTSCNSFGSDRDDRFMVRVFPSIRESRSTSELTRSRSAQAHMIRGEFIGV